MLSCCFVCFGNGLNDSAPGALIPSLERDYKIGYAVVSLIFVSNALGFISAACFTDALAQRLGRAKALMIAMAAMFAGYFVIVFTPPFPAVVLSFYLFGLGMGISLALNNVFVANLANNTAMLGTFHGSYGIGGIIGPLIATAMVSHGFPWSRYYLLALGVAFLNLVFAGWAFWTYEQDAPITLLSDLERTASKRAAGVQGKRRLLREALRQRTTVLGAIFIFAYQGAEVSISGWVISFLITYRNGNPADVGYVTAGFWAGITLGRFLLSHPAHKIGEKRFVAVAVVLSAGFQLIVWLVPDVVGNAVAVSIVGLLLGPVYPCAMAVFSQHLGRRLQVTALGFISAMGSSGGAVAPFMTGLGAQAAGTWILHPVCIGLYVLMEACWLTMPRSRKRTE
ncbi:MAG: hypothetical protein M1832_000541 [Thelocarpon impressellum]|nr:MAG: hypothetical protein M1832_000541 [Thelocarpon impressellum]